ncbi:unnamed protein product, partial [Prorocentrum cordatum]
MHPCSMLRNHTGTRSRPSHMNISSKHVRSGPAQAYVCASCGRLYCRCCRCSRAPAYVSYEALKGRCEGYPEGWLRWPGPNEAHCYWGNPDLRPGDFLGPPRPPPEAARAAAETAAVGAPLPPPRRGTYVLPEAPVSESWELKQ